MQRDLLDGVVVFLEVAKRRSFTAAAATLGVSAQAVSQAIKQLEARVGVPLLTRTTRDVGLSEAGERFLEHAQPGAESVRAAIDAARALGASPSGLLRINLPSIAAVSIIEPLIAGFCSQFPEVELELFVSDAFANIVDEGFDAGIRLGEAVAVDMVAVRLTREERFVVTGSPAYFAKRAPPQHPDELRDHACINFRETARGGLYRWEFEDGEHAFAMSVKGPLVVNSSMLALAAGVAGIGLTYTLERLVTPLIRQGLLISVLERFCPKMPGYFLYYPARAQAMPKLRAFIDFVRQRKLDV